jgi:SecD/SecF fusion protein
MKTKLYLMIASILIGTIATSFSNKAIIKNKILIESPDINASSASLNQSVNIITKRLKDYSSKKFEINTIPDKNQIEVVLSSNWDMDAAEKLLTQKGSLAFYETFNKKSFTELFGNNINLVSLFNTSVAKDSDTWIGKCSIKDVEKVNEYLEYSGFNNKCKFAWSLNPEKSEMLMYALKADKGTLLTGEDIEKIRFEIDKNNLIMIEFKTAAVQLWADITKRNMGNAIAMIIDDVVYAAPYVKSAIEGGKCIISGNFTKSQIKLFTALGNNGELPLKFKVVK